MNTELIRYNRAANIIISLFLLVILLVDYFVSDKFSLERVPWILISALLILNLARQTVSSLRPLTALTLIVNTVIIVIGAYSFMFLQLRAWSQSLSNDDPSLFLSFTLLLVLLLMISATMQMGTIFRGKKRVKHRHRGQLEP